MSHAANLESARLTVALDVRHPFAYLALRPTIAFGEETGLEINWLPLVGPTLKKPSTPGADDDRGIRHRRHRARTIAREIAIYAEAQGLVVEEPYRDGPADAAHLGWLWMRAKARPRLEPFLEDLFRRYWTLALDANSTDEVAEIVEHHGGPAESFRTWASTEGPVVADGLASSLRAAGITQAPAYLIDDEVFWGRQHLAMVRWILDGRKGHGPI